MIRKDQERQQQQQDDESSHDANETVHEQGGGFRELISGVVESSPLTEIGKATTTGWTMDSDENDSSQEDEGDHDDEDDKRLPNKTVATHHSLDASPGGIDRLANFPLKLHQMLERAEIEGFQTTVSWLQSPVSGPPTVSGTKHGESSDNVDGRMGYTPFKVHNPDKFVKDVIPRFFQMTKFKSFLRQLNIWGFSRDRSKGILNGSYYHKDFVREDPDLCRQMRRTKNKGMYKRGTKGTSPAHKSRTGSSSTKIGSTATSYFGNDGIIASEIEELRRDGSSISSTSHPANHNEVGGSTARSDLASLNRDMIMTRNTSITFPITYRPMMRGLEKGHRQFGIGDSEVHTPSSRQVIDGSSSTSHQQILLRGQAEAHFLLDEQVSRAASVMNQDRSADRQNSLLFSPPLPSPSSREVADRIRAQGGSTSFASTINPTSSRSANWPHGAAQGERQGVFSLLNVGGQPNATGAPSDSLVADAWRLRPFAHVSSLQQNSTSTSTGPNIPRSDNIAQLLTNPQMRREDLKYILVGFQLGAATKEEDDNVQSRHPVSSSLEGAKGEAEPDDEHDPSPL